MPRPKQPRLENLTWQNGVLYDAQPARAADHETPEVRAMLALSGWGCRLCGGTLSATDGYACCDQAHCPVCGAPADNGPATGMRCEHHVFTFAHGDYLPRLERQFARAAAPNGMTDEVRALYGELFFPGTPGLKLTDQPRRGYPVWGRAQWAEAYPAHVLPHVEAIWGPTLRKTHFAAWGATLLGTLAPDLRTRVAEPTRHLRQLYFSSQPDEAARRVYHLLQDLKAGRERLRSLPAQIVRNFTRAHPDWETGEAA